MNEPRTPPPWIPLSVIGTLWLLFFHYGGLEHDAVLYSFQAAAHQHPQLLSGDIYLRYGSQDRFTFFTPIYSALANLIGIESAAALLTFSSGVAVLGMAWVLARRLTTAFSALAGIAMLLALPSDFGPLRIFHVLEPFITARMPAEALALGALLAAIGRRWPACVLLIVASAAMHPLMAAPVAVIAAFLWSTPRHPRWPWLGALAGLIVLAIVGSLPLLDGARIDDAWRAFINDHARYNFLASWSIRDWARLAPTLATLWLGARVLPEPGARPLCVAALFTAALGFSVMLIGADVERIALIVQGQGYRWAWPACLIAPLLLPAIARECWSKAGAARAALLLLATAWLVRNEWYAIGAALLAIGCGELALRLTLNARYQRWMFIGTMIWFGALAAFALADTVSTLTTGYDEVFAPPWFNELRHLGIDGLLPAVLVLLAFGIHAYARRRATRVCSTLIFAAAFAALLPAGAASWSRRDFTPETYRRFGAWRALIPERSEVVWIDSPEATWLLLERPSYFSIQQTVSGLFSRPAALELAKRQRSLVPLMRFGRLQSELRFFNAAGGSASPTLSLAQACETVDATFIVSRVPFDAAPLALAPPDVPVGFRTARLYRCEGPHRS